MANTTEVTKELYFKICDFLEEMYGDLVKVEDYPIMWAKILHCISSGNYILTLDNSGEVLTYQGWFIDGDTIWIEDNCTKEKKVGIFSLIKALKSRYINKGFKYVKYYHRCQNLVTWNIERYTKHESL